MQKSDNHFWKFVLVVGVFFLFVGCGGGGSSSGGSTNSTAQSGSGAGGNTPEPGADKKKSEEAPKGEPEVKQEQQVEQQQQQEQQQQPQEPVVENEPQDPVQEPQPEPEAEPLAEQQPEPQPVAEQQQPQAEPEPQPVAEQQPEPEPEPQPVAEQQPEPQPQQQAEAEPAYVDDPNCWNDPANFCVQILPASGAYLSQFGEIFVVFNHSINVQSVTLGGQLGGEANNRIWAAIDEPNEHLTLRPPQGGWSVGPAQNLELRGIRNSEGRALGRLSATFVVREPIVYVAPDGNDANPGTAGQPKQTIQEGIRLAAEIGRDSRVHVAQGEYHVNAETNNNKAINIAFKLQILGGFSRENWSLRDPRRFESVIIDDSRQGGGNWVPLAVIYAGGGSESIFDGFVIQTGRGIFTAAIFADNNSRATFSNNVIVLETATDTSYGVYSLVNFDLELRGNIIREKEDRVEAPPTQYGIFISGGTHSILVQENQIELESGRRNFGIYMRETTRATVLNNQITLSGQPAYGLYFEGSGGTWMQNRVRVGGEQGEVFGIYVSNAPRATVLASNQVVGGGQRTFSGIHLITNPQISIFSNTISAGQSIETNYALTSNASDFSFYNNLIDAGSGRDTYGMVFNNGSQALVRNNSIHGGRGTETAQAIYLSSQGVGNSLIEAKIENNILMADGNNRSYCVHEPFIPNEFQGATPASFKYNDLFGCRVKYHDAEARCQANDDRDQDVRTCSIQAVNRLRDIAEGSVGNVSEDPLFVDFRGADGDVSTFQDNDWHLSQGTPRSVREEGLDGIRLNWDFNEDKDGLIRTGRPNGRGWSMGAFEQEEQVANF